MQKINSKKLESASLAKEELKASEENYRAIFNSASDTVFIHNIKTGQIVDVNERVKEMFGYNREEALKMNVGDFSSNIPPYTQADAQVKIKTILVKGPQAFEWQARHKDGHLFWVEINLKLANIGNQKRLLVSMRDITDRKQAEEETKQRNIELEKTNRLTVGRELKMIELKKKIKKLEDKFKDNE